MPTAAAKAAVAKATAAKAAAAKGTNWQELTAALRYRMNMPADAQPWTSTHSLVGMTQCARHIDLVQVAWWAWSQQNPGCKDRNPKWYCDVSQQVNRKPWGPSPDCFLQAPDLYMFGLDRVADAEDSHKQMIYSQHVRGNSGGQNIYHISHFGRHTSHVHVLLLFIFAGLIRNDGLASHGVGLVQLGGEMPTLLDR